MDGYRGFLGLLVSALLVGFLSVIFTLVWVLHYREGLGWDGTALEFNWHPVLVVTGFVFIQGIGTGRLLGSDGEGGAGWGYSAESRRSGPDEGERGGEGGAPGARGPASRVRSAPGSRVGGARGGREVGVLLPGPGAGQSGTWAAAGDRGRGGAGAGRAGPGGRCETHPGGAGHGGGEAGAGCTGLTLLRAAGARSRRPSGTGNGNEGEVPEPTSAPKSSPVARARAVRGAEPLWRRGLSLNLLQVGRTADRESEAAGDSGGASICLFVVSLSQGAGQPLAGVSASGFTPPRAFDSASPRSCQDSKGCFAALPGRWSVLSPACFCGCRPAKVPFRGLLCGAAGNWGRKCPQAARGGPAAGLPPRGEAGARGGLRPWRSVLL